MRLVDIIKAEKVDWHLSRDSIGAGMLHEPSSLTLRTGGVGNNDGIRSTKAFLTQVTPRRGGSKIHFADGSNADITSPKSPRRIFGAEAYLERQKKMSIVQGNSPSLSSFVNSPLKQ